MIIDTDQIYLSGTVDGMKMVSNFIASGDSYVEFAKYTYGDIDNKYKWVWKSVLKSLGRENEFEDN